MAKLRTAEQIRKLLREADSDLAKGLTVGHVCRKIGVSEQSYYRWRQLYDGEPEDATRRVRELEAEVRRLKTLVADLALDKQMLQEVAKKVVTARQRRRAAEQLCERFAVSERRACRVVGQPRSTQRYEPCERDGEAELLKRIAKLAERHPRYGVRRIAALLRREGWRVNRKRVHRLWRSLGLQRPLRRRKPRKRGSFPGTSANSCAARPATRANDVWCWDFLFDRTSDGRSLKWLSLVDEFTRECLVLRAARSMTGAEVARELARVVGRRGVPAMIRSDNGPEFIGETIREWLAAQGVETLYIAPASPWENGFAESFHSRLRDEFLNREVFETVGEARVKAAEWRREYNTRRPHSSLDYSTPAEFASRVGRGGSPSLRSADPPRPTRDRS